MGEELFVLSVIEGRPGPLIRAWSSDEALYIGARMVQENDPESAQTMSQEEILRELEEDGNWASNQGDIWVHILKAEDWCESQN